jgi:hypothetical protein
MEMNDGSRPAVRAEGLVKHYDGRDGTVEAVRGDLRSARARSSGSWVIGARTLEQLEGNLGALELDLPEEQRALLDQASAVELGFPHDFAARPMTQNVLRGGVKVAPRV